MSSRIETLVDGMTLAEQVSLLSGEDFWSLPAIARLNLPKLRVTDGPNGARGGGSLIGGVKSAAFPVGIALGASWNVALAREIGSALADEVKSKGAHVSLAPTVNLHRSVANGRNFECYSEDPILTAELAVGYITGLQEKRVSATIKHFVGNESEIERTTMSSEVSERALRELYLVPFEWAVKKAGTWGIMSSYNRLNGTYTSEHSWLLDQVLRKEWTYSGIVMSDWFGSHSTAPTVNAGLDLEMPGPSRDRGALLVAAVEAGEVSRETIRTRVLNILRLMERTGAIDDHSEWQERADDRPEHRALIRRAGAEAAVLLKNTGILPLSGRGRVAVIGPNAKVAQIMGGGSAQLNPHYSVSPHEGLSAALGADRLGFAVGATNHRFEPVLKTPLRVEYFDNAALIGTPVHTETQDMATAFWIGAVGGGKVDPLHFSARLTGIYRSEASGIHRIGIYAAGLAKVYVDGRLVVDAWRNWTKGRTFFEEGCDEVIGEAAFEQGRDYEIRIEFATKPFATLGLAAFAVGIGKPLGDEAIAEAVALAKSSEVALVFVGRSGEWDTEGSDLASIALPGRQNELVSAVAKANSNTVVVLQTGGPVEMPWLDDVAAVIEAWYPGQEAGNAIADVLTGAAEPGGRLPQTFPRRWADNPTQSQDKQVYPGHDGKVRYEEGVFIGYRHYDKHGITPLFPFGFGLSYTQFRVTDFAVDAHQFESDGTVSVSMTVHNIGTRAGSEVVQVYVADPEASLPRPRRELKAFAKVHLAAGQSERVTLELDERAFAFFSEQARHWVVEPGRFNVSVARNASDPGYTHEINRTTRILLPV
jgi:beta-glucosidase